ncbi:MAG: FAD-binding protein [Syntrophaceae bacterium]|nr:FAD-binding protein [Syntrophaceae bacterium]
MPSLKITGVTLLPGEHEGILKEKIASLLNISCEDILSLEVVRKSIDARRKREPRFIYSVKVSVPYDIDPTVQEKVDMDVLPEGKALPCSPAKIKPDKRPVVVGCGPAGLFAAHFLAERGIPVLLLERGRKVTERLIDVQSFWEKGILNAESHVHFGEGGAGTFSDGKLTSRVKNPFTKWVKTTLIDAGAPSEILSDAKPHIGTDRLRDVVVNLREKLIKGGCEVRFESGVTDCLIHQGNIEGIIVKGREEIKTNHVILATGQSAADTYWMLYEHGVRLEPKPFAMGLRVEHPQELIDGIQYGKWCGHPHLPPADYFLTATLPDMNRSVYTFCMCPGGYIIGCSAEEGGVVTNGMSLYKRDHIYANSAVVVNVRVEDFQDESSHPLSGFAFRRRWEEKAFAHAGNNYYAPAQRLVDFLQDREGTLPNPTSFSPGVKPACLRDVLPPYVADALKRGISEFDRKMRGFITEEATLIGVETRTSSPVRIVRGSDCQSVSVAGLFPCGEGAGYAGGIVSSALDGIRIAKAILSGK